MLADSFTATIGYSEGYGATIDIVPSHWFEDMIAQWQRFAEDYANSTGVYVTAHMVPSVVLYPMGSGCPNGGEVIAVIRGTRNPHKCGDFSQWRANVLTIVAGMKSYFRQTTAQVEFTQVDFYYFKDGESHG